MDFARQFGLDVELVDRVRTTTMLDLADKDPVAHPLVDLRGVLASIQDVEFVIDRLAKKERRTQEGETEGEERNQ